jgi:hypothetical protein
MILEDFCETFNVSRNNVTTQASTGKLPQNLLVGKFINEKVLHVRKDFQQKIWIKSHENYYFLSKHIQDADIAYLLSLTGQTKNFWQQFINDDLFATLNGSITNYRVTGTMWKFYKYTCWVIQHIFKLVGIPRNKRNLSILIER